MRARPRSSSISGGATWRACTRALLCRPTVRDVAAWSVRWRGVTAKPRVCGTTRLGRRRVRSRFNRNQSGERACGVIAGWPRAVASAAVWRRRCCAALLHLLLRMCAALSSGGGTVARSRARCGSGTTVNVRVCVCAAVLTASDTRCTRSRRSDWCGCFGLHCCSMSASMLGCVSAAGDASVCSCVYFLSLFATFASAYAGIVLVQGLILCTLEAAAGAVIGAAPAPW